MSEAVKTAYPKENKTEEMINRIFNIYLFMIVAFIAVSTTVAQETATNYRKQFDTVLAKDRSFIAARAVVPGVVSALNQQAFQIGKDFAIAIEDSKYMGTDDEFFNFTIVDLVYLIDGLEGQPEAQVLHALLKGIVRETKDLSTVSAELQTVSKTYLARQTAERKWYFNVGSVQMDLLVAAWGTNNEGSLRCVKELQGLIRTAPQGTPQIILDAIKGLSKYAMKPILVKEDLNALANDTKIITTLVYA